jgi:hypothetical protein
MLFTQINSMPFFPAFLEWNKTWSKNGREPVEPRAPNRRYLQLWSGAA